MSRIPCINPRCGRTAPADKYEPGEEIICRGCWRALPKALTDRYKDLNRRERRLLRMVAKRVEKRTITAGQVYEAEASFARQRRDNWQAMRDFFRPVDRPEGLDAFLEEVGL